MENMGTLNREACLTLNDKATAEDLPHIIKVFVIQSFLPVPGRFPLCLKCKKGGDIRRQYPTPKCTRCNRFGHKSSECFSIYTTALRGNNEDTETSHGHLMNVSEVVDVTGDFPTTLRPDCAFVSSGGSAGTGEKLPDGPAASSVVATKAGTALNDITGEDSAGND